VNKADKDDAPARGFAGCWKLLTVKSQRVAKCHAGRRTGTGYATGEVTSSDLGTFTVVRYRKMRWGDHMALM
jgi:hypothetical protein